MKRTIEDECIEVGRDLSTYSFEGYNLDSIYEMGDITQQPLYFIEDHIGMEIPSNMTVKEAISKRISFHTEVNLALNIHTKCYINNNAENMRALSVDSILNKDKNNLNNISIKYFINKKEDTDYHLSIDKFIFRRN